MRYTKQAALVSVIVGSLLTGTTSHKTSPPALDTPIAPEVQNVPNQSEHDLTGTLA